MYERFYLLLCKFVVVTFLFVAGGGSSHAQDTSRLQISIITCEPGSELYSIFGHSAIRVVDSNFVADVIYNFGTFDFSDPDFYQKFIQGKLKYFLSIERTEDFIESYKAENRGITEQVLLLSAIEKRNIRDALAENIKEENRFYLYDFFLDNCTTRLRDIVKNNRQPAIDLPAVMPTNFTFRNAIHQYLDEGKMHWSKLGIDLLLGAPTDAVMTIEQQQFLPENLMIAFEKNSTGLLVLKTNAIYTSAVEKDSGFVITPLMCSLLLFFIGALLTWISIVKRRAGIALQTFDSMLFLIVGLLGCLFIFMWLGTDHTMTKRNYNLLWAIPFHVVAAFLVKKKTSLAKNYFLLSCLVCVLVLIFWAVLPQELNFSLIPIVLLLAVRSAHLYFNKKNLPNNAAQEV